MTRWSATVACCVLLVVAGCRARETEPPQEPDSAQDPGSEATGGNRDATASSDTSRVAPPTVTDLPQNQKPIADNGAENQPGDDTREQPEDSEPPKSPPDSQYDFMEALKAGEAKLVAKALEKHGEWATAADDTGRMALHIAAQDGTPEMLAVFLQRGLDVNARTTTYETPLHLACTTGQTDNVNLLLRNKAEVDAKTKNGETPLHIAAALGYKDVVQRLLLQNADPMAIDNASNTPLHQAARCGSTAVARRLLKRGVDVNARNEKGETPLTIAKKQGTTWMIQLLRQQGGVD